MNEVEILSSYGGGTQVPDSIIVHVIGEFILDDDGKIWSAIDWLDHLGLSVHKQITPGGTIITNRKDEQIAYHAKDHNEGSLGIEFQMPGLHNYASLTEATKLPWVKEDQFQAGLHVIHGWYDKWNIKRMDRHSDIDPKRRWYDPGDGFPWLRLQQEV